MLGMSLQWITAPLLAGLLGSGVVEPIPAIAVVPAAPPEMQPAAPAALAPAAVMNAPVCLPDLSGRWSGSWLSYCTGHKGPLRATFRKAGANCYDVHFRGRFCKLIPFCYTARLRVTGYQDGRVYLSGSKPLPLFGTFSFSAYATSRQFVAGYTADDDRGQFLMTRQ